MLLFNYFFPISPLFLSFLWSLVLDFILVLCQRLLQVCLVIKCKTNCFSPLSKIISFFQNLLHGLKEHLLKVFYRLMLDCPPEFFLGRSLLGDVTLLFSVEFCFTVFISVTGPHNTEFC